MKKILAVIAAACIAALPLAAEPADGEDTVEIEAVEIEAKDAEAPAQGAEDVAKGRKRYSYADKRGRYEEDGMLATLERAYEMRDALNSIVDELEKLYKGFEYEKAQLRSISFESYPETTIRFPLLPEGGKFWERIDGLPFTE